MRRMLRGVLPALALIAATAAAQPQSITLASTTSTEQSGFFAEVLPTFRADTGIEVRVIAVGSGQAFDIARRGDADALLVHDRAGEDALVAEGVGLDRREVMVNDFLLVGPGDDPAGVRGAAGVVEALGRIAAGGAVFASRGDDSGTHRAERRHWAAAGIDPTRLPGYRELGSGMGATLNTAADLDAHTLTDRASWAGFGNRRGLVELLAGDPALVNPYASVLVDPRRHPHVRHAQARAWHEWLVSERGQAAIAAFRIHGEAVFRPTAGD